MLVVYSGTSTLLSCGMQQFDMIFIALIIVFRYCPLILCNEMDVESA